MQFKFKHVEKIVGGFFVVGVAIVVVLVFVIARGQRWFQDYSHYSTCFSDAMGLRTGDAVMMRGMDAGRVFKMTLEGGDRVRVDFGVFTEYSDRMREGCKAAVDAPVVGSAFLKIIIPKGGHGQKLASGGVVPSIGEGGGLDALIASANRLIDSMNAPQGDLKRSLANISAITRSISDALTKNDTTLKRLVERKDLYNNLNSSMKHLKSILFALDESSPDMRDAIVEARRGLKEVNKVVRALQKSIFLRGNITQHLKENSTLIEY